MSDSGSTPSGADSGGSAVARWVFRHRLALLAGVAVLGVCLWLMHAGALPIVPPRGAFEHVRWWTVVPGYVGFWLLAHWLRSARWYWLLQPIHPVSMRRTVAVSFVGYGALLVLPFRLGEAVRPAMIRRKGELSAWAAASTVVADRIIDGLFFAILLFAALQIAKPMSPLPDHIGKLPVPAGIVPVAAYAAVLVFTAAFACTALFYWRRAFAVRLTRAVFERVMPRLADRAVSVVERLADGFSFLPRLRYTLPFLGVTVCSWACVIAGQSLLMWGCGFEAITLAQSTVIACVLALGILAPNAPGFFGAFQISAYAGLALYLPPSEVVGQGSVFVFLIYVGQTGVTLITGVLALLVERFTIAQVLQAGGESIEIRST